MRHPSAFLNFLTVGLSVFAILFTLLFPEVAGASAPWIVVASVFIVGIPHGAIDHIMAAELYGLNQTLKDHLVFYASYLVIMLLVGLLWVLFPVGGMILFLAISIYHFGQADMEEFMQSAQYAWIDYLNRGVLIIGLIIFSDPSVTYPIIADAIQVDPDRFTTWMPAPSFSLLIILILYVSISGISVVKGKIIRAPEFFADNLVLIILLLVTGPLIGFAIYFALWHSAGHIIEMKEYFKTKGKPLTTLQFYVKALPFTLISIVGLALLLLINIQFDLQNQFLTLMFILISVLTLPHMFIVDKMYSENKNG